MTMNGKLVAVWGSPGAGTTTFCAALAQTLSHHYNFLLLCNADPFAPANAVWNILSGTDYAGDDLKHAEPIRKILASPSINTDYIKSCISPHPGIPQLGLLGGFVGETYEQYDPVAGPAAGIFLFCLRQIAQVSIIDCMQPQLDRLSVAALEKADVIITLIEPNPLGRAFVSAQNRMLSSPQLTGQIFLAAKAQPDAPVADFESQTGIHFDGTLTYTSEARARLARLNLFSQYSGEYGKAVNEIGNRIRRKADEQSNVTGDVPATV